MQQAKEAQDVSVLEKGEETIYEDIFLLFKEKAVGTDVQAFESSLRKEIYKKYKEVKKQFNIFSQSLMEKKYGETINDIKRGAGSQFSNSPTKDSIESIESKVGIREQLANFK